MRSGTGIGSKHIHVFRTAGQGHLQFAPLAKIKFDSRIQRPTELRVRGCTNAGAQRFCGSQAHSLKVIDPADFEPWSWRRIQRKHAIPARIKNYWSLTGAIYSRKVSANPPAHWHHRGTNGEAGHR